MKKFVLLACLCVAFTAMYGQSKLKRFQNVGIVECTGYIPPFKDQIYPTAGTSSSSSLPVMAFSLSDHVHYEPYMYLTEEDVADYITCRVVQRLDIVRWMYRCLTYHEFDKQGIEKYFNPLCSSDIRTAIAANKSGSPKEGWQIFLLPSENDSLQVIYEGNDWFRVEGDGQQVRLQIVYVGKQMRAVLVGLENPTRGINIALNPSTTVKGYRFADFSNYYYKPADYHAFMNTEISAYAKANPQHSLQGLVTEGVMNAYREKVQRENELIVRQFYANLTSNDFVAKDFSSKYKNLVLSPLKDYVKDYKKYRDADKDGWDVFMPGKTADDETFNVKYAGANWYEVSAAATPTQKVRLMTAQLTDKDHTPVIIGLQNAEYDINTHLKNLSVPDKGIKRLSALNY